VTRSVRGFKCRAGLVFSGSGLRIAPPRFPLGPLTFFLRSRFLSLCSPSGPEWIRSFRANFQCPPEALPASLTPRFSPWPMHRQRFSYLRFHCDAWSSGPPNGCAPPGSLLWPRLWTLAVRSSPLDQPLFSPCSLFSPPVPPPCVSTGVFVYLCFWGRPPR